MVKIKELFFLLIKNIQVMPCDINNFKLVNIV